MKSMWTLECADSICPMSGEEDECPNEEAGREPAEHNSMKTSTPSVIFDLQWKIKRFITTN